MTDHVMIWISAILPLFSFLAAFALYYKLKNGWLPTVVVLVVTLASLILWFTMTFWSWLLLYLFLCWLGCWAAGLALQRKQNQLSGRAQR